MVSDADVCLRKMLAIPTLKDRSSGTCLAISDVIRWHPLDGAVTVMVRCAHPAVPVTIYICKYVRVHRWAGDAQVQRRAQTRHAETTASKESTVESTAVVCVLPWVQGCAQQEICVHPCPYIHGPFQRFWWQGC